MSFWNFFLEKHDQKISSNLKRLSIEFAEWIFAIIICMVYKTRYNTNWDNYVGPVKNDISWTYKLRGFILSNDIFRLKENKLSINFLKQAIYIRPLSHKFYKHKDRKWGLKNWFEHAMTIIKHDARFFSHFSHFKEFLKLDDIPGCRSNYMII